MRAVLHEISAIAVAGCVVLGVIFAGLIIHRIITGTRRPRPRRPRLGRRGIGPAIEHIDRQHCPDCLYVDDDGEPIRIWCLIHDKPDPDDDLSLWDAELQARRPWHRRILWEDQHQ